MSDPFKAGREAIVGKSDGLPRNEEEARVLALFEGWYENWPKDRFKVLAVEKKFELPIYSYSKLDSKWLATDWNFVGIFDLVVRDWDGSIKVVEHKTTSANIEYDASDYLWQAPMSNQLTMYICAMYQMGVDCKDIVFDVAKKSKMKMKKLTVRDIDEIVAHCTYCGGRIPVSDETVEEVMGGLKKENYELFYLRLLDEYKQEKSKYFRVIDVVRHDWQILEWFESMVKMTVDAEMSSIKAVKNSSACHRPGWGTCEFVPLCNRDIEIEDASDFFQERKTETGGFRRLSHSRISCLQTCQMKHHLRYNVSLEKKGYTTEALSFGSLFHEGMDAYFNEEMKNDRNAASV